MYARLRPNRSPNLLPIKMNAAETNASSAIADCTPLTVVFKSWTTAEIDTFMIDVSTTSTNIAIASSAARRPLCPSDAATGGSAASLILLHADTLDGADDHPRRVSPPRCGALPAL